MKGGKQNSHALDNLKIMIVSTPKTGNTWMTHLLSAIYDLPEVIVPPDLDIAALDRQGPRWITLRHYYPEEALLTWADENQAQFVTMIRHPGDVLVSIWHMFLHQADDPNVKLGPAARKLPLDGGRMGEYATSYAKENFFHVLHISLDWMKSGRSFVVRYEDLWRDPVKTLTKLTDQIQPADPDRIQSAIDVCDINLLRKLYNDPDGEFYRKGGPGSWREEIPDNIVEVLRTQEPYPGLFRELGYTLDPRDPLIDAPAKPRASKNPFLKDNHFDNGVKVPVIAIKRYLLLDPELKARWSGEETSTAKGSFFAWLNAPVDESDRGYDHGPVLTNLAYYVYCMRLGIQKLFPDIFGQDRIKYIAWFILNAPVEYDLDPAFIRPMSDDFLAWCDAPADEDPIPVVEPTLTNLALYIYHIRPDLQEAFPDVFGKDRIGFARWFVNYAPNRYASRVTLSDAINNSAQIIYQTLPEADNRILALIMYIRLNLSKLIGKIRT